LLLLSGFLMYWFGWVNYGQSLFVLFPFAVGYSTGTYASARPLKFWMLSLSLLLTLIFLVITGFEAFMCVVLALPLMLLFIGLGYWVGRFFSKKEPPSDHDAHLQVWLWPLLLLWFAGKIEQQMGQVPEIQSITTSKILAFAPESVFDHIKAMDTLDAPKPLLLRLGLPSPNKCTLQGEGLGGVRTCHFDEGKILTTITAFDRPNKLNMDIVQYSLPGGSWFVFHEATYTLAYDGTNTSISRTSTYTSSLNPRWYWGPLEKWCIEQEHVFVLESLDKNLSKLHQ